jgi:integrase/recombinase XerD
LAPPPRIRVYRAEESFESRRASLVADATVDAKARGAILAFVDHLGALGLTVHRQNFYLSNLRTLARLLGRSFVNPTRADLERVLAKIEKTDYEYWTKVNFRTTLKRFYKWHLGNDEEYPAVVRWIRTKNGGRAREKTATDLLTPEEVEKLLEACAHPRDKALVSLLYDSGCRISEVLTLRWGHVTFESWGAALAVSGKTGRRRVVVVGNSIPYLLAWKETHPLGGEPEAPVFVGQNAPGSKQGGADEPMNYASARRVIKMAAERAELRKRIHPHLFRHTRATELAKKVTEAPLEAQMGWVPGSGMAKVYVHLSGRDQDAAILKAHGIKLDEGHADDVARPKLCPRCDAQNASNAKFCRKCGMPLEAEAALRVDETREHLMTAFMQLASDPKFQKLMARAMAKERP